MGTARVPYQALSPTEIAEITAPLKLRGGIHIIARGNANPDLNIETLPMKILQMNSSASNLSFEAEVRLMAGESQPEEIVLFGSRAHSDAREDSVYDLLTENALRIHRAASSTFSATKSGSTSAQL